MRQQWEYCVIYAGDKYLIHYQKVKFKAQEAKTLEEAMEILGNDGWELVSMDHSGQVRVFYFKRPV